MLLDNIGLSSSRKDRQWTVPLIEGTRSTGDRSERPQRIERERTWNRRSRTKCFRNASIRRAEHVALEFERIVEAARIVRTVVSVEDLMALDPGTKTGRLVKLPAADVPRLRITFFLCAPVIKPAERQAVSRCLPLPGQTCVLRVGKKCGDRKIRS